MTDRPSGWPRLVTEEDRERGVPDALFERLRFQLSYKRARGRRRIFSDGIDGPTIPNSYLGDPTREGPEWKDSPGDWTSELCDARDDPVLHVLRCGVNEAVHEALEWLRLDGGCILDPHGPNEALVYEAVGRLVEDLFELAKTEAAVAGT